jgi:FAD/FMN-containing dehydrogenase/Fe-S oxidoreductase
MQKSDDQIIIAGLKQSIEGDVFDSEALRLIYATDASAYREIPFAVVRPRHKQDIKNLIVFAGRHKIPLIPRAAGTSLAGQVVGNGIVVDIGKYMNRILEINPEEKWVRVEPGVVLDELNQILAPTGLFFAPETSTSNRCMLAGMVGNNSCGAHSIIYGSTRDHTLEIDAILSDASEVVFKDLTPEEFEEKKLGDSLESSLYRQIFALLGDKNNQAGIRKEFPDPAIHRRNTGYAIDILIDRQPFTPHGKPFNMCQLLAGSEGTLAFTTGIKLKLEPLPPPVQGLVCVHLESVRDALRANLIALRFNPWSVELMDHTILDLTKENREQDKNRFFVQGNPGAILIVEFAENTLEKLTLKAGLMCNELKEKAYGFAYPLITGSDMKKVWALRKAGLGVLSNMPGDAKPVPVIEDTAVNPELLPDYIAEFDDMLNRMGLSCVYYAHIATGELHLRPVLNLKDPEHVRLFRQIAYETALLVKKYKGSLSGEHGDGRLRGEFIPLMIGQHNYELLRNIKNTWDPHGIFNPGKITDTPRMHTSLRYEAGQEIKDIPTIFDFSDDQGILRAAERCNGSADCRKTEKIGGTMCPSYMATRDEQATTRARANILREMLTRSPKKNPFNHKEIYEIMDLCLSCKACKSECPSNVDVAKLKAEFLQHYYDANGIPLRTLAIAYISSINHLGSFVPGLFNYFISNPLVSGLIKKILGFATERKIPHLSGKNLRHSLRSVKTGKKFPNGKVLFFNDEFSRYNDTGIAIKAIQLLTRLGYEVIIPRHTYSGRSFLSKGMLRAARRYAVRNVLLLKDIVSETMPLVAIEPSAILAFRDEYPDLCGKDLRADALNLGKNCLMIDEFLTKEFEKGKIQADSFISEQKQIKLHGHCQQKAIASTSSTKTMLEIPAGFRVTEIPSGCCGMAGSFGYEKEHYALSQKVGELVLFPEIRKTPDNVVIAAPGTSCRHQIEEGTGRKAMHPIEILYDALLL